MAMLRVQRGDRGETVRLVQALVGAEVDGIYGPATERRVREWCRGAVLRVGRSNGPDVLRLQHYLEATLGEDVTSVIGLEPRGTFDRATERAVATWQAQAGIYSDGIVGPVTRAAMAGADEDEPPREAIKTPSRVEPILRVPAQKHGSGYTTITVRESTAQRLEAAAAELATCGAFLTSSGGLRALSAAVTANRAAKSLHYTGAAFDLYMYSGMVDPSRDPFVIVADDVEERLWRVWARAPKGGVHKRLSAATYTGRIVEVEGEFVDFTALMQRHGFDRIPWRPAFEKRASANRQDGAAEWWHWQDVADKVIGVTTFGEELLRVWTPKQLEGSGPWRYRAAVWTGCGF